MPRLTANHAEHFVRRAFTPVDGTSLAVFRIGFGLTMLWEVYRSFQLNKIYVYYIRPEYRFPYDFFEWVEPWAGDGMYYHFAVLGVCAAAIALGIFYRLAATVLFFGITYVFLLDATRYLNHMYLVCLVSALMVVVPADAEWSLRRMMRGPRERGVLGWHVGLLRAQIGIVYFFGGIAKINGDWLVGVPLREWLSRRKHYPVIGHWLNQDSAAYFFSYGGLLFDLLIVPLLMTRKTRVVALAAALGFHLFNAWIFGIGIFPWFMLFATALFFEPDWPRQVWQAIRAEDPRRLRAKLLGVAIVGALPYFILRGNADLPCLAAAVTATLVAYGAKVSAKSDAEPTRFPEADGLRRILALGFVAAWVVIQVLVPLRHHLIPGDVAWTEEGHRFAWRMKLRQKHAQLLFRVERPGAEPVVVVPSEELSGKQVVKMGGNPVMIRQYAHHLADRYTGTDGVRPEVYVRALVSLNGRRYRPMIDESFDLAAFGPRPLSHQPWITAVDDPPPKTRRLPTPPQVSFAERNP